MSVYTTTCPLPVGIWEIVALKIVALIFQPLHKSLIQSIVQKIVLIRAGGGLVVIPRNTKVIARCWHIVLGTFFPSRLCLLKPVITARVNFFPAVKLD